MKQRQRCITNPNYPDEIHRHVTPRSRIRSERLVARNHHETVPESRATETHGPSSVDNQEMISSLHSTVTLDQGLIPMPTLEFRLRSSSGNNEGGNITEGRNTDDLTRNNISTGINTERRSRYSSEVTELWSEPNDSPRLVRSAWSRIGSRITSSTHSSSWMSMRAPYDVNRPRIGGQDVAILPNSSSSTLSNIHNYQNRLHRVGTSVFTTTSRQETNTPRTVRSTTPLEIRPVVPSPTSNSNPIEIPPQPLTESSSSRSSSSVEIRFPSLTMSSASSSSSQIRFPNLTSSSSESGTSGVLGASPDELTIQPPIQEELFLRPPTRRG